jgi:hypothetical protein
MLYFIRILSGAGFLKKDIDYHLMRASTVIIFLAFGYQKWFEYEAEVIKPFISNSPLVFWLIPAFGVRGASWFLGTTEWTLGGVLEQTARNPRSRRFALHFCFNRHNHSVHAQRLGGLGWWLPGDDDKYRLPSQGRRTFCGLFLFAETGRHSRVPLQRRAW